MPTCTLKGKTLGEILWGENDHSKYHNIIGAGIFASIEDAQRTLDAITNPDVRAALDFLEKCMRNRATMVKYQYDSAGSIMRNKLKIGPNTYDILYLLADAISAAHPDYFWTWVTEGELVFEKTQKR